MSMVVDTSAIAAVLLGEPERDAFRAAIERAARRPLLSAMTLLEASLVMAGRRGEAMLPVLDALAARLEVVPFDEAMARTARDAFLRFGKGRHPAGLNYGDCAAYALAKQRGLPLLFKGEDFARTDLRPAMPSGGGGQGA